MSKLFHALFALASACTFALAASAQAADVIVNEYNAVGSASFLEGGGSDPYWGARAGNGGNWFELVVVTDHLDMRGWQIELVDDTGLASEASWLFTLTTDSIWADLRAGTIVTVSDSLGNNVGDYNPVVGRWWINVRAHPDTAGTYIDVVCVSPACLPAAVDWNTSNDNTQVTVKDDLGSVVFGPAGEGVNPPSGVGSDEVLKLEQDPSAAVTPTSNYNDGRTSTFGQENQWGAGLVQDFSALRGVVPYSPLTSVVINEILVHSDPGTDWVELVNTTGSPVDIGGWLLSDSFSTLTKYTIPSPTVVPAGGHVVFDETTLGFALSSACGDELILSQGSGGVPTGPRDYAEFGPMDNGVTLGRTPDGSGPFVRLAAASQGAANGAANIGPVVINEIMYHPPSGPLVETEFVELYNHSATAVDLWSDYGVDGVHGWKLTGGIGFQFAPGTTIDAGEYLVVVAFDPATQPTFASEFRSVYGIPSAVTLVGPYSGGLNNFSDTVRLRKPDTPETQDCNGVPGTYVPFVLIDEVTYFDFGAWPSAADGGGSSLERVDAEAYGDDPANWAANLVGSGSPGNPNTVSTGPPSRDQQKCVDALNKDMEKVASTLGKDVSSCVKDFARDSLATTLEVCVAADRKGKVGKAKLRTENDHLKRCTGTDKDGLTRLPSFGPTDATAINDAADTATRDVFHDIFGVDLDAGIISETTSSDDSKCQQKLAKTITKCLSTTLKEFRSCKKRGMKDLSITDASGLEACLGSDPRSKIAKTCDPITGKIANDTTKSCVAKLTDLSVAFPGCAQTGLQETTGCMDASIACRTCIAVNAGDSLALDCDAYDDGASNASCP
jgi:hypothetical protein